MIEKNIDRKNKQEELSEKIMEGLRLAAKKLIEQSIRDNQPLIIGVDKKIETFYPARKTG